MRHAISRPSDTGDEDRGARPRSASIVINNFNYERFVGTAIQSALRQTHPAQVVVVDDASTDGSRRIIASFGDRIEAVFSEVNLGQASAMNQGFRLASGDIVIFLDSDDVLEPTAVATVIAKWRPGIVFAQYPLTIIDAEAARRGILPDPPTALADGDVRHELVTRGTFAVNVTSGLAFDRRSLARVMPIPERLYRMPADGYLVRMLAFLGNVQRIDVPLGSYRAHGANDSDVISASGGLAAGFRKKIRYAESEFKTIREAAARHGFDVAPDLGERNPDYLGYRLFSLLLDARHHPMTRDRLMTLLPRYVTLRWRSPWALRRKVITTSIAIAACAAPASVSWTLVTWLHDPRSRPEWLRRLHGSLTRAGERARPSPA